MLDVRVFDELVHHKIPAHTIAQSTCKWHAISDPSTVQETVQSSYPECRLQSILERTYLEKGQLPSQLPVRQYLTWSRIAL